jgi:Ni2+-binding GTPase involved in maturation of urease and hydrogenase
LKMRGIKPFIFSNLKTQEGLSKVTEFIVSRM